jgi:H+/gluconate symporter-like permease
VKFALASKGPANRSEAWACVTANLALPGSGSLAAGKSIGYYQLALAAIGFIISIVTGIHLLEWMLQNWTRINEATGDPFDNLITMWREIRWPLAGLGIFIASLLWAGMTSMQILSAHPKNPVPPRIAP